MRIIHAIVIVVDCVVWMAVICAGLLCLIVDAFAPSEEPR